MEQTISKMLASYEGGRVTRRQLIRTLTVLAAAGASSPAYGSTFHGLGLNHIALRVSDIPRSRDFYQKHFGLPLIRGSETNCFLGMGKNFLTLFKNANPGLDHYCIAIEKYDADSVVAELKRQGLNPDRPSGTDRVCFPDPDSLTVQVSASDHFA